MAVSTKLSVAVHVLVVLDINREKNVTSDYIASSVNTNPVVIRKIMSQLKKAGILHSAPGTGPTYLLREPHDISLNDIYQAVEENKDVLHVHKDPNRGCPVGYRIQAVLEEEYEKVQKATEIELSQIYLSEIIQKIKEE